MAITISKLTTIETLEQGVKYNKDTKKGNNKDTRKTPYYY